MGTNFRWKNNILIPTEILSSNIREFALNINKACSQEDYDEENIFIHIGKRYAAGLYCFKCGTKIYNEFTTNEKINYSKKVYACPICSTMYSTDDNCHVKPCSGFTWTAMAHLKILEELSKLNIDILTKLSGQETLIENEYGNNLTIKEFLEETKKCPIWSQNPNVSR